MFEGGENRFNPMDYVQSPLADGLPIKDTRIYNMFKKQMKIDFIFIRFVLLGGNLYLLATDYINQPINQLVI